MEGFILTAIQDSLCCQAILIEQIVVQLQSLTLCNLMDWGRPDSLYFTISQSLL